MKTTQEIINRFLFNLKQEFSGKNKVAVIEGPCKGTTNETTWLIWMNEFPKAEFSIRKIGARLYFMMA